MEEKINTLKAGLLTGLKASPNNDLYENLAFYEDFTEPENLRESSVWDSSGYSPKQVELFLEGLDGWIFTMDGAWMCPGIDNMNPHLFPLSSLTKEIRVEGYNDGKAFVMSELLNSIYGVTVEYDKDCGLWYKLTSTNSINIFEGVEPIIQLFKRLHFNTEGLDPSEFIDAAESKVYTPK